jgi:hypothetical protein
VTFVCALEITLTNTVPGEGAHVDEWWVRAWVLVLVVDGWVSGWVDEWVDGWVGLCWWLGGWVGGCGCVGGSVGGFGWVGWVLVGESLQFASLTLWHQRALSAVRLSFLEHKLKKQVC